MNLLTPQQVAEQLQVSAHGDRIVHSMREESGQGAFKISARRC
jgi:hypothetical protein